MQILRWSCLFALWVSTAAYAQNAQPAAPAPAVPAPPPPPATLNPAQNRPANSPPVFQQRPVPPGLQRQLPPAASPQRPPEARAMTSNAVPAEVPRNGTNNIPGGTNTATGFNDHDRDDLPATNVNQVGSSTNAAGGFTNQLGGGVSNRSPWAVAPHVVPDEAATPQDRALVNQLRRSLLPEIRRDHIPVHLVAQNGVVTITGVVPSAEESQEIVQLVQGTPGVVRVDNQLTVNEAMAETTVREDRAFDDRDRDLLGHVRGEIRKHHTGGAPSESVHLLVRNGVVTLFGFVTSPEEQQRLVAAAQSTPGVVRVEDRLRVRGIINGTEADRDRDADLGGTGGSTNVIGSATNAAGNSTNQVGAATSPGGSLTGGGTTPTNQPGPTNTIPGTNTPSSR